MSKIISFGDEQFSGLMDEGEFVHGTVFVIMPFSPEYGSDDVFSAIDDECRKLRLTATRVDRTTGSGIVMRRIIQELERSEFIIADLTGERPNVYYELGYAHGDGNGENDILIVAKRGTELHFDNALLSVKSYSSTEELGKIVNSNRQEMIRVTR